MSAISSFISQQVTSVEEFQYLPLMHSCECYDGRKIIHCNQLQTQDCKVFNDNLLYFFYGKPAYPIGEKAPGNRTDIEYCPICFIVPVEKVNIYRAFPFDTGAYKANIYKDFLHRNMDISAFELDGTPEGIQHYIQVFFGNNDNYVRGEAVLTQHISNDPHVSALVSILNAVGAQLFDERAITVEAISHENISISDVVECIILPENLLRDENILSFLDSNQMHYITYTVRRLTAPSRYNEVVFEKAMEYIKTRERGDYNV